mgnify:CR=1 FL=1
MSEPKFVRAAHMCHDAPWLLIKTQEEVKERIAYIKGFKPERERPLRLKLLKIIKEPLPPKLAKAYEAWVKAYDVWVKANAAWVKANAAWVKAINSREGVAFHKKVCGCAWSPKQPDILLQIAAAQEEKR